MTMTTEQPVETTPQQYRKVSIDIKELADAQAVSPSSLKFRIQSGMNPQLAVYQARAGKGSRFAKCNDERIWLAQMMESRPLKDIIRPVPMRDKERITIVGIYQDKMTRKAIAGLLDEHPYSICQYETLGLQAIRQYWEPEWEPAHKYENVRVDQRKVAWFRLQIIQYGFEQLVKKLKPKKTTKAALASYQREIVVLAAYYMEGKTRRAIAGIIKTPYVGKVVAIEMKAIQKLKKMDLGEKKVDLSNLEK